MIKSSDLFHTAFYSKSPYSGSLNDMRFYIEKSDCDGTPVFKAWVFEGPFCFEKTKPELKRSKDFAFTDESIPKIADWLNEQYTLRPDYWKQHKSLL